MKIEMVVYIWLCNILDIVVLDLKFGRISKNVYSRYTSFTINCFFNITIPPQKTIQKNGLGKMMFNFKV